MAKKKFDSAKKHFEKERLKLVDQIKAHQSFEHELLEENNRLQERVHSLEREKAELKDWVNRLLEYTELSKEDIKKVCDGDKKLINFASYLNKMFKIVDRYGG